MSPTAKGISEDWLSVWIGLLVFVLALGMLAGTDILGWVVPTGVWTDVSKALTPISKPFSAFSAVDPLSVTYVALLVFMTAGPPPVHPPFHPPPPPPPPPFSPRHP